MAEEIKTLTVKMGGDATGVQRAAASAQAATMQTAQTAVKASSRVAAAAEDTSKRIASAASTTSVMGNALRQSAQEASKLGKETREAEQATKRQALAAKIAADQQKRQANEAKRLKEEARKAAMEIARIKKEGMLAADALKSIGGGLQKFDAAGRGAEECHAHSFARNVLGSFGFRPEKGRPAADGLFEVGRCDADVIYLGHTYLQ